MSWLRKTRRDPRGLTRERAESALSHHRPHHLSRLTAPRRAAVAALLRFDQDQAEVLVMKRVDRKSDRWSGHVSFPGGMEEKQDTDLKSTAIRETREEVGISLDRTARYVGQLSDVRAIGKGKVLPMAITPFVFFQTEPETLVLNHEAQDAFWLPLGDIAAGSLDGTYEYPLGPVGMKFPCWNYNGYVVWGLTYRMINMVIDVILDG